MDSIGDRMKRNYERPFRSALPWRVPVILRIDGRAFHTYTRGLARPFDEGFIHAMNLCAISVCEDAQGAAFAYVQSDEINVLLINYRKHDSQPWFENEIQKMVSVAASTASATLTAESPKVFGRMKPACFDARVLVVPEADVNNYFLWRQQDATRNALQMMARANYSPRELHRKDASDMRDMLSAKGIHFNHQPTYHRRGRCIVRESFEEKGATRFRWVVDEEIPLFNQNVGYIEQYLPAPVVDPT